jgi:AbiU2
MSPETVLDEFYNLCAEAGCDFDLYRSLFEQDAQGTELCVKYAPLFFADFSRIITRALVLQICRLTDPAGSGDRTNLTTNYILKKLRWPENVRADLARLNDLLMDFREKLDEARNKRIAHNDLPSQLSRLAMGTFEPGADVKFFTDLQDFFDLAYRHVHGRPAPAIRAGISTDTYKVIRAIEKAILYDRCPRCTEDRRASDVLDFTPPGGLGAP